jgi:hypothetical protein
VVEEPNQEVRSKNKIYKLDASRNERQWCKNQRVNDRTRGKRVGRKQREWAHKRNIRAGPGMDERIALHLALGCMDQSMAPCPYYTD